MLSCALVLLCGLSGTAKADTFDVQSSIQDPVSQIDYACGLTQTSPFAITFGACQLGENAYGCFYGVNDEQRSADLAGHQLY